LKVLIADDHALLRDGLISALVGLGEEAATCYEAEDAAQVMDALATHPDLDLILLDLFMPGANGFELLSSICDEAPGVPVAVLSGSEDIAHMRKALDCGASGFIPKSSDRDLMLSALRLILAGGVYVPSDLIQAGAQAAEGLAPAASDSARTVATLTARQQEVLRLLVQGRSNKQIARELGVSQNTVKVHVAAILRSLGAANRTEAVALARDLELKPGDVRLPG
jgi:DNA-binding NarL/FixJ family response regulator